MGHIDDGIAQSLMQLGDFHPRLHPQFGVKIGQRLVKQKHLRIADDGTANGDALTLPARQRRRFALQQGFQLQDRGGLGDLGVNLGLGAVGHAQTKAHVLRHGHVGVQGIGLKHHRQTPLGGVHDVHPLPGDVQIAAGDLFQPRNAAQQSGFSATRRADEHGELALLNRQRHVAQHLDPAEAFGQVGQFDLRHGLSLDRANGDAVHDLTLKENIDGNDRGGGQRDPGAK